VQVLLSNGYHHVTFLLSRYKFFPSFNNRYNHPLY